MEIEITQQDIDIATKICADETGSYSICTDCPTSQAIKRLGLLTNPSVGYLSMRNCLPPKDVVFTLSNNLSEQVRSFTLFRRFKPGIYEIVREF